jgi:hypothetical protein
LEERVELRHLRTSYQVADLMTKAVDHGTFRRLTPILLGDEAVWLYGNGVLGRTLDPTNVMTPEGMAASKAHEQSSQKDSAPPPAVTHQRGTTAAQEAAASMYGSTYSGDVTGDGAAQPPTAAQEMAAMMFGSHYSGDVTGDGPVRGGHGGPDEPAIGPDAPVPRAPIRFDASTQTHFSRDIWVDHVSDSEVSEESITDSDTAYATALEQIGMSDSEEADDDSNANQSDTEQSEIEDTTPLPVPIPIAFPVRALGPSVPRPAVVPPRSAPVDEVKIDGAYLRNGLRCQPGEEWTPGATWNVRVRWKNATLASVTDRNMLIAYNNLSLVGVTGGGICFHHVTCRLLEDPSNHRRFHRNISIVPFERVRTYNDAHPDAQCRLCKRCSASVMSTGPNGTRFKFTEMRGQGADRYTMVTRFRDEDRSALQERIGAGRDGDDALDMATYVPIARPPMQRPRVYGPLRVTRVFYGPARAGGAQE